MVTEIEMVGWHHRLNGLEFEQTLGDSEGQGSLVCCSPWGCCRIWICKTLLLRTLRIVEYSLLHQWVQGESIPSKDSMILEDLVLYPLLLDWFSSIAQSCPTLCNPLDCSTPGFPAHRQLWKLAQTHIHRVGDAIQPSHPLLSPSPPTFNLSQHQGLFQGVSSSHQVARSFSFWSFSFSISPSNDYSGLISFRMDWLDLLAVQGILKSLLQHHSSKASVLWHSALFIVKL